MLRDGQLRAHLKRRSAAGPEDARLEQMVRAIMERTSIDDARDGLAARLPRVLRRSPLRLAFAAGAVAATLLATSAVLVLAPGASPRPTTGPKALQVLDAAALARLTAAENLEAVAGRVVIVDGFVEPAPRQLTCLPDDCEIGRLTGVDPPIRLVEARSAFARAMSIPAAGAREVMAVRILRPQTVELIGPVETNVGFQPSWPLGSFQHEVEDHNGLDVYPAGPFLGPLFVVEAYLADTAATVPCLLIYEPPPPSGLEGFKCGRLAWLAPSPALDPQEIVDGSFTGELDWVRLPNGSYQRFAIHPVLPGAASGHERQWGFFLVEPVLDPDPSVCEPCHPGGSAVVVARLEALPIP